MQAVVVIGGGAAGMTAASRIKKLSQETQVTVVEETSFVSHAPCGVPYYIEGLFSDTNLFMAYTPEFFSEERGIVMRTRTRAEHVDTRTRRVTVSGGSGPSILEYDQLIYCAGARPKKPPVEGIDSAKVVFAHHPAQAEGLRQSLWSQEAKSVLVVGAGVLGLEMAEALSARGKRVTLVHRGGYPMSRLLDAEMGGILSGILESQGVVFRGNESLIRIEKDGSRIITDSTNYEADRCLIATGVEPNLEPVYGGSEDSRKPVEVDEHMRVLGGDFYAAGDCASSVNIITGKRDWQPYGPVANKMGYVAGGSVCGASRGFPGVLGTVITKFREYYIGKTGFSAREAAENGFRVCSSVIKAKSRSRYYPGGSDVHLKLVAEEGSLRLLGVQLIAKEEVLGRVNTVAAMIGAKMTAYDLFFTELGYLPAVTTVWDPLIVAARRLIEA